MEKIDQEKKDLKKDSKINKDLLLCENPFYLEKSKLSNKLDFKNDENKKIKELKTERITSNVLSKVKGFLDMIKANDPACVNIEDKDNETDETDVETKQDDCDIEDLTTKDKQDIELNLLLFQRNDSDDESSDDDSDNDSSELNESRDDKNDRKMVEVIE